MIPIKKIIHQLTENAGVVCTFIQPISIEQAAWKPDEDTWSLHQVMDHFYNEERLDFRRHLKEMFSIPQKPWGEFPHAELITTDSCHKALEGFLAEREASLDWLRKLESPDWEITATVSFNPGEEFTLRAGDILYAWVAHDYLHIRQINELFFAWTARQALPYSVRYAGEW